MTAPIYLLSIHHLRACCDRPRPWLMAVHSQLWDSRTAASKHASAGEKKTKQEWRVKVQPLVAVWPEFRSTMFGPHLHQVSGSYRKHDSVNHRQPRPHTSSILDPVDNLTLYIAPCLISPQRNSRNLRQQQVSPYSSQIKRTYLHPGRTRHVWVILASSQLRVTQCHLAHKGRKLYAMSRGIACAHVCVCACEAGAVTQFSSHPQQFTVDCAWGLLRHSRDTLLPSGDGADSLSLSLAGMSGQIHTGAMALACWDGVRRRLWDLKRERFDQASFQSRRWSLLRLSIEPRPL